MDYSQKGILLMLQDLQREYFGKRTMFVQAYDNRFIEGNLVACAVFDDKDNPHCYNFSSLTTLEDNKKNYIEILNLLKNGTTDND